MGESDRPSVSPGANRRGLLRPARIREVSNGTSNGADRTTVELAEVAGDTMLLYRRRAARRPLARRPLGQRRPLLAADRLGQRAARVEAAATRRPRGARRIAAQQ